MSNAHQRELKKPRKKAIKGALTVQVEQPSGDTRRSFADNVILTSLRSAATASGGMDDNWFLEGHDIEIAGVKVKLFSVKQSHSSVDDPYFVSPGSPNTVRADNVHPVWIKHISQLRDVIPESADSIDFRKNRDTDRLNLLESAAKSAGFQSNLIAETALRERQDAVELLGGTETLGRQITSDAELVEAISQGFPSDVLNALRAQHIPSPVLEKVIAPRRTLMRRKSDNQRLTRVESDSAWRLAWAVSLASQVFKDRKAAIAWMGRPKENLRGLTGFDLIETSVGTSYIGRILHQLEWGDVA